ncbi:MAG TPA: BT_3928 family protein [Bacteroidia bacterium]|jgi:uncharacterized membrane protein YphA (DoxX/SURF4 family)|nr:BT_3928 family protein [Bacteroidia bacterium]
MKKFLSGKAFKFIASAGIGLLFYWLTPSCLSKTTQAIILGTLFILINGSGFISRFPVLTHIPRILVGGLFIFSGFIKSNDALGFSYKLEEYFEVFKADTGLSMFEWFAHISLPLAIIICVSEVALGFMLLIGFKRELTLWLLLAQIIFFTFLTFYSACYSKVTGCGCFGDAIKLTPWESFWKDIALLILITLLFSGKDHINPLFSPTLNNIATFIAIAAAIWFPIYCYRNLPVIDFRAYAPGLSICEGMKPGPDYKPAVYESRFIYKNIQTGDTSEFTDKNYPWQDTLHWKYQRALGSVVVTPGVDEAKITDFTISDLDGNVVTDTILQNKNFNFYLVCYDLTKTEEDPKLIAQINDFYTLCEKEKIKFIALTSSSADKINEFKHKHNALYDFYSMDGIVLKTMIRSNPGLMLMKDCRVIKNWHHNNWPVYSDVKNNFMK